MNTNQYAKLGTRTSDIWRAIISSVNIYYKTEGVDYSDGKGLSAIGQITAALLQEEFTSSVATGGFTGNHYARALIKLIGDNAKELSKKHFDGLTKNGAIINAEMFLVNYQPALALTSDSLNIILIVALYAECISTELDKTPLSLETIELAYSFFLYDFKRYLIEKLALPFHENEEVVDWMIIAPGNTDVSTSFVLVTNRRLRVIVERKIREELILLDGENQPLKIHQNGLSMIFQTNKRLLWCLHTILYAMMRWKLFAGDLEQSEPIKSTLYLKKSKLFMAISDNYLIVWFEGMPLKNIALATLVSFEKSVQIIEKKVLFLSQKVEQTQITFFCPNKLDININRNDQDPVLEFLAQLKK